MRFLILGMIGLVMSSSAWAQTQAPTNSATSAKTSLTLSPQARAEAEKIAQPLHQALIACQPFQASMKHPFLKSETIKFQVYGPVADKCKFSQTLPGNVVQACLFSAQQRDQIKAEGAAGLQSAMANKSTCTVTGY